MKNEKILRSWLPRADARPRFAECEQTPRRPIRVNSYGFVDPFDVLGWLLQEEDCYSYFKLARALCSHRIARLKAAERRPKYYEAENARRRALAAERRKIRSRATTNPCPTREAILEAWHHRRDSHAAAIRFGSLLEDLECYLDNSLRRDENGVIIGRNAGIKGWLFDNLPDISDRYTTAMRYKAAAKKLKQVAELADPTPAEAVLSRGEGERKRDEKDDCGAAEAPDVAVVRARAIWMEVVEGVGPSATALMRRLDALVDPKCVEEANMLAAWREKYANEITERTKKRWWRRLVKGAQKRVRRVAKGRAVSCDVPGR
jgi:hypothetical protein